MRVLAGAAVVAIAGTIEHFIGFPYGMLIGVLGVFVLGSK